MSTKDIGNLFELAEKQLQHEVKENYRYDYTRLDILNYAIALRKQLDKYGKTGQIFKVKNIHTRKMIALETKTDRRHRRYIETGK